MREVLNLAMGITALINQPAICACVCRTANTSAKPWCCCLKFSSCACPAFIRAAPSAQDAVDVNARDGRAAAAAAGSGTRRRPHRRHAPHVGS